MEKLEDVLSSVINMAFVHEITKDPISKMVWNKSYEKLISIIKEKRGGLSFFVFKVANVFAPETPNPHLELIETLSKSKMQDIILNFGSRKNHSTKELGEKIVNLSKEYLLPESDGFLVYLLSFYLDISDDILTKYDLYKKQREENFFKKIKEYTEIISV